MVNHDRKAVVFDMDGVLIDSEWLVLDCWKRIAEKYQIPGVEEVCRGCLGTNQEASRQIFLEKYGPDFPYDAYKAEGAELFHQRAKQELKPKPGVILLMDYLKEKGYRIGLATSTRKETAVHQLTQLGIMPYFDSAVFGDMVNRSKPEPDIYRMACELLHIEPVRAYAVEDSYNGIRAASRAGMKPIMVPDLVKADEEMRRLSVCILDSLKDVAGWLKEQENAHP